MFMSDGNGVKVVGCSGEGQQTMKLISSIHSPSLTSDRRLKTHTGRQLYDSKACAHLTVQFDVFSKCCVDFSQGAAQPAAGDVDQILEGVHVVVLHKVLAVL